MQQKLSMQILVLVVENATEFLSMHIFIASGNGDEFLDFGKLGS
jgi:hypothetical protein